MGVASFRPTATAAMRPRLSSFTRSPMSHSAHVPLRVPGHSTR
jgi:hypothetical protein